VPDAVSLRLPLRLLEWDCCCFFLPVASASLGVDSISINGCYSQSIAMMHSDACTGYTFCFLLGECGCCCNAAVCFLFLPDFELGSTVLQSWQMSTNPMSYLQ
jgi:hypothetical protein